MSWKSPVAVAWLSESRVECYGPLHRAMAYFSISSIE